MRLMNKHFFTYRQPLKLENGQTLQTLDVVYHTYGTLNADKSNVVWFCHALTANSDVSDWWGSLVGEGKKYPGLKKGLFPFKNWYSTTGLTIHDTFGNRP